MHHSPRDPLIESQKKGEGKKETLNYGQTIPWDKEKIKENLFKWFLK